MTASYDADGIDVYFLNHKAFASNVRVSHISSAAFPPSPYTDGKQDASTVNRLFERVQPTGTTPIGGKLEELLLTYLDKIENAKAREIAGESNALKAIKGVNYIVLTDGAPSQCYLLSTTPDLANSIFTADDPEDVIVMAARRLDRGNFPITQVDTYGLLVESLCLSVCDSGWDPVCPDWK